MRIHGESGIPEGSYSFWKTLWEAVPAARTAGRQAAHHRTRPARQGPRPRPSPSPARPACPSKAAQSSGRSISASVTSRPTSAPPSTRAEGVTGTFAVSNGARNFTRYGYGDFYSEGLGIELLYRVWPGTQRHLLWGDPALASGYGRAANFCGAAGLEIMEPLFFKGREGSGHPGGRDAYAESLWMPRVIDLPATRRPRQRQVRRSPT